MPKSVTMLERQNASAEERLRTMAGERLNTAIPIDRLGNMTEAAWRGLAAQTAAAIGGGVRWEIHREQLEWDPKKPPRYGEINAALVDGGDLAEPHWLFFEPDAHKITLTNEHRPACYGCDVCGRRRLSEDVAVARESGMNEQPRRGRRARAEGGPAAQLREVGLRAAMPRKRRQ